MWVLGADGLKGTMMHDVTEAAMVARMLYAAPAWWVLLGVGNKLDSQLCCDS